MMYVRLLEDSSSLMDIASTILSNLFLFLLVFGLSATVNLSRMKAQLTNAKAIFCGVVMQFLIMPFLGWAALAVFHKFGEDSGGIDQAMGITLLVVTASPGGSFSNLWCSLFNADLALSVAMTTVSSIASIAMLPLNLFLYTYLAYGNVEDEEGESVLAALDFNALFLSLILVLVAISSGIYLGNKYDNHTFHELANKFASMSGLMLILFSVFLSSGGTSEGVDDEEEVGTAYNQGWYVYAAIAFPCLMGLILANLFSLQMGLPSPEAVTIAIECCYQNTGIATAVAISMFTGNDRVLAVAVPLLYGLSEALFISLYCITAWKIGMTKAPADEQFWTIIHKSYEIEENLGPSSSEESAPMLT